MERVTKHSIRVWKPLPNLVCFKTVRLMIICNEPKRTIFVNSKLGLLQMALKGVDYVISYRLKRERSIPYKGVETSPEYAHSIFDDVTGQK